MRDEKKELLISLLVAETRRIGAARPRFGSCSLMEEPLKGGVRGGRGLQGSGFQVDRG